MGKLFRLLVILLVISLSALSLTACRAWESSMTLMLTVTTPENGATVTASPVTVSGTVNKTATVSVNGAAVPVKGGKFSTSVTLTEGNNEITVVATADKADIPEEKTVSKTVTVTYKK